MSVLTRCVCAWYQLVHVNSPSQFIQAPFKCALFALSLLGAMASAQPKPIPRFPHMRTVQQCASILEKSNPYAQELKSHLVEYRAALLKGDFTAVKAYVEARYPMIFPEVQTASGPASDSALQLLFHGHFESLHESAESSPGRIQILELLLSRMSESDRNWLDRGQENALHWAVRKRFWNAVPYLVSAGVSLGQRSGESGDTFLDLALRGEIVHVLAEAYGKPEGMVARAPLNTDTAAIAQKDQALEQLLRDPFRGGFISTLSDVVAPQVTPLHAIPISEFPSQLLAESGDSLITYVVRNWDRTDLRGKATRVHDSRHKLRVLLTAFDELKIPLAIDRPHKDTGRTALWFAARSLDAKAVELLLMFGANPKIRCKRMTGQDSTTPEQEVRKRAGSLRLAIVRGERADPKRPGHLTAETEREIEQVRQVAQAFGIRENLLSNETGLN